MFKRFLNLLEDPKRPLLGPNVKALKFWGLLLPKQIFKQHLYLFIHLLCTVFTATAFVDIYFIKADIKMLLDNIKITILSLMIASKRITFLIWQEDWKKIIGYVTRTDIERRLSDDVTIKTIVTKYTKYCRKLTYSYWFLIFNTVTLVVFPPLFKFISSASYRSNARNSTESYIPVLSSWVPFDKSTLSGYLAASAIQTFAAIFGSGWITSYDTTSVVVMAFLKGELEMIKKDSGDIFGDDDSLVDDKEALERIRECQKRHAKLMKYVRLFDSCLSPIMLLYMIVCSAMLCVTAYQITIEISFMQKFSVTVYLIFGIAQLFMYCWHSNDIFYTSKSLMQGPYESLWWTRNTRLQKDLYMLTDQFKIIIVLSVGHFTQLSVPTFVGIIKGAYSYYTLLSKSQMK